MERQAGYARREWERRDEASAKLRRTDAALGLLEACEKVEKLAYGDAQYLAGVKAAIAKAKDTCR